MKTNCPNNGSTLLVKYTGRVPTTGWTLLIHLEERRGMHMTDFEIISTILAVMVLLLSFGGFIIAVLTFLDKRKR